AAADKTCGREPGHGQETVPQRGGTVRRPCPNGRSENGMSRLSAGASTITKRTRGRLPSRFIELLMSFPIRHLPVLQNWDCHVCGTCCKEYLVTITDEERKRIEA